MASRNLIILSGHVVSAPKGMKDAVKFKVLNIEKRKDGPDDRCEIDVVAFGELGSRSADLKQGDFVEIEGSMYQRVEEFVGRKKYYTEIKAWKVDKVAGAPKPIERAKTWDIE